MIKMAKSRLTSEQAVTRLLAQLPAMGHKELRQHWREQFDREPSQGMHRYGQRTLAMEWTEFMARIISGPTR